MKTKLTLSVDKDLIEKAKRHAEAHGTSVSKLVEKYFALMGQSPTTDTTNSPFTQALRGALSDPDVSEDDYYRYLDAKHRQMRVLFDTNVAMDVLKDRAPFADAASALFDEVAAGAVVGLIGGTTVTTIYYLLCKSEGHPVAVRKIRILIRQLEVAPVGGGVIEDALDLGFSDFEDAVLHEAGRHARAEAVVTRNGEDFQAGSLLVYTPQELLKLLRAS